MDLDSTVKILDKNYERNFLNKKVLILPLRINFVACSHDKHTFSCQSKGGKGKTTTAVNTSAVLSGSGRRVLLVDFDPQANATMGSGLINTS